MFILIGVQLGLVLFAASCTKLQTSTVRNNEENRTKFTLPLELNFDQNNSIYISIPPGSPDFKLISATDIKFDVGSGVFNPGGGNNLLSKFGISAEITLETNGTRSNCRGTILYGKSQQDLYCSSSMTNPISSNSSIVRANSSDLNQSSQTSTEISSPTTLGSQNGSSTDTGTGVSSEQLTDKNLSRTASIDKTGKPTSTSTGGIAVYAKLISRKDIGLTVSFWNSSQMRQEDLLTNAKFKIDGNAQIDEVSRIDSHVGYQFTISSIDIIAQLDQDTRTFVCKGVNQKSPILCDK